jgi:hypothetical protein
VVNSKAVQSIFMSLYHKGVKVEKKEIETKILEMSPDGAITNEQKLDIITHFVEKMTPTVDVNVIVDAGGDASIQVIDSNTIPTTPASTTPEVPPYEPVNSSALTKSGITDMVMTQAEVFNVDLQLSDIKAISNQAYEQQLGMEDTLMYVIQSIQEYVNRDADEYVENVRLAANSTQQAIANAANRKVSATNQAIETIKKEVTAVSAMQKSYNQQLKASVAEYFKNPKSQPTSINQA